MRSTFYKNYGGFKVWQRPPEGGFEVRQGNRVLARHAYLFEAMKDASARLDAFWDEQARVLKEMKAKGEL